MLYKVIKYIWITFYYVKQNRHILTSKRNMILKGDTILAFLLFFICALGVVKNTFESNMDMRVHIFYICLWIDYI